MNGQEGKENILALVKPWLKLSYDEIWELSFSPTLKRSHMVLSDGKCPVCDKDVPMYEWQCDVWNHPLKIACPNYGEWFLKNNFYAYYKPGLNQKGYFRYDLAGG